MYVCVWVFYVYTCFVCARCSVFIKHFPPYLLRQGHWLNLEFADEFERLARKPRGPSAFPVLGWYRLMLWLPAFFVDAGGSIQSSGLQARKLLTELSLRLSCGSLADHVAVPHQSVSLSISDMIPELFPFQYSACFRAWQKYRLSLPAVSEWIVSCFCVCMQVFHCRFAPPPRQLCGQASWSYAPTHGI